MLKEQKSLVAAKHLLGQLVGQTPLSTNVKGLVGNCKPREGSLSPSLLCAGSRYASGLRPCSWWLRCPAEQWMPWSCRAPGPWSGGGSGVCLRGAQLCCPLAPTRHFVLQREYGCCLRNPISLKYKICFQNFALLTASAHLMQVKYIFD